MAVGVVLLVGAVFLALAPFDAGASRCGAPLLGAEIEAATGDQPVDTLGLPTCGDDGARRLVYAAGLFLLGSTVIATGALLPGTRRAETQAETQTHAQTETPASA